MNLKSTLMLSLGALLILGACKRGEDDPAISFSSRDARITGDWDLTTGTYVVKDSIYNQTSGGGESVVIQTTTSTFGENIEVVTVTNQNGSENQTSREGSFDFQMSLLENGSMNYSFVGDEINPGGGSNKQVTYVSGGSWFWSNNMKNKTGVVLNVESDFLPWLQDEYRVKRLTGSEMVLYRHFTEGKTETAGDGGIQSERKIVTIELNFAKQ